ncbi:MAG: hypothetical protein N3Z28_12990 [Synechococcaceae cyanobacterium MAG-AL2]|uniref:hypothetical protein n=1 Tax=Candidatus Regnicoccus frigidus TaxID=3074015 RepID=UPI0028231F37|nr:hypothetical protein [Candidatus Regnicoccus frigidus]MCT4368564.1 hypothetical protein [Candidatus Regnicoccus frigidus MAG-AL2]
MSKTSDKVMWAITGLMVLALASATALLVRQAGTLERLRQAVQDRPHQIAVSERPPQETPAPAAAAGERILFLAAVAGQEETDLWAIPAAGGEATRLAENVRFFGPTPLSIIDSGDEQRLAFVQGPTEAMRLVTLDLRSGQLNELFAASEGWWLTWPSASPDGQHLAFVSHEPPQGEELSGDLQAVLYVVSAAEGNVEKRIEPVMIWTPLAWSPDGQWLAVVGMGASRQPRLTLLPAEGGVPQVLPLSAAWLAAWSPDSMQLTTAHREFSSGLELVSWDVAAGREVDLAPDPGMRQGAINYLAWSPDGEWLLGLAGTDWWSMGLYLVGREGGEPLELFAGDGSTVPWARWSPDGEHIAFIVARGGSQNTPAVEMDAYVVQPDGGDLWQVDERLAGLVRQMAWSSDGQRLAFALNDEEGESPSGQLYVVDLGGQAPAVLHEGLGRYFYPLWLLAAIGD